MLARSRRRGRGESPAHRLPCVERNHHMRTERVFGGDGPCLARERDGIAVARQAVEIGAVKARESFQLVERSRRFVLRRRVRGRVRRYAAGTRKRLLRTRAAAPSRCQKNLGLPPVAAFTSDCRCDSRLRTGWAAKCGRMRLRTAHCGSRQMLRRDSRADVRGGGAMNSTTSRRDALEETSAPENRADASAHSTNTRSRRIYRPRARHFRGPERQRMFLHASSTGYTRSIAVTPEAEWVVPGG